MAYMRGKNYVWDDGTHMHLHLEGTVSVIPLAVFDVLALMRVAELLDDRAAFEEVLRRGLAQAGNFGADGLLKLLGQPTAMDYLRERFQRKMEATPPKTDGM